MSDDLPPLPDELEAQVETADLPDNLRALHEAMRQCVDTDECEHWADQYHRAMLSYARQARDPRLEDGARQIKRRAIGKFLELFPVKPGERTDRQPVYIGEQKLPSQGQVAKALKLTRREREDAIRAANGKTAPLAKIPHRKFEEWVEGDPPASPLDKFKKKPRRTDGQPLDRREAVDRELFALNKALFKLDGLCDADFLTCLSLGDYDTALRHLGEYTDRLAALRERYTRALAVRESVEATPAPVRAPQRRRSHVEGAP